MAELREHRANKLTSQGGIIALKARGEARGFVSQSRAGVEDTHGWARELERVSG